MGAQIKILQKGKVTLPARIREALGVGEGDYLMIELKNGKVVMSPNESVASPTSALAGLAAGIPIKEPLDEEIQKSAAGRIRRKRERAQE